MQLGRAQDSFDAHAHSLTLDEDDTYARRGIGPLSPARPLEHGKKKGYPSPYLCSTTINRRIPRDWVTQKQTLDSFEPPFFPDVVVRCSCVSGAEIVWGYRASLSSRTFEYQLSSMLFHTEVSALAY